MLAEVTDRTVSERCAAQLLRSRAENLPSQVDAETHECLIGRVSEPGGDIHPRCFGNSNMSFFRSDVTFLAAPSEPPLYLRPPGGGSTQRCILRPRLQHMVGHQVSIETGMDISILLELLKSLNFNL